MDVLIAVLVIGALVLAFVHFVPQHTKINMMRPIAEWARKQHIMWIVVPYLVASALSTFPSLEGVICLAIEWVMFFFVLASWRVK